MGMKAQEADNAALCAKEVDAAKHGDPKCQCIGIDGRNGTASAPGGFGSRCEAWEQDNDPKCADENPPEYCQMAWCYVDPCDCDLDTPSKPSSYLPDAVHQGRPVHFSYVTCGGEDKWSSAEAKKQAEENKQLC